MAFDHYPVRLISQSKGEANGQFILDEDDGDDDAILKFQYPGGEITRSAADYFEAMCQIRNELEAGGWRPVCYGSSQTVYPSGMCRNMGRGLKAYRLHLGRPAANIDLVSIFDTGPDVEPSSVAEQQEFWEEWLRSVAAR
jgi:hypothetical protein